MRKHENYDSVEITDVIGLENGFIIRWASPEIGFGEYTIHTKAERNEFGFATGDIELEGDSDLTVLGLAMDTNMKAPLCVGTLKNAVKAFPGLKGAIVHSDRGTQYTSEAYRNAIKKYGINQSMNSDGGRCHDNARCESMWARMKSELLYGRYDTKKMLVEDVKVLIWRYFISYWNNRRICSSNGGLPPAVKRKQYYEALAIAA